MTTLAARQRLAQTVQQQAAVGQLRQVIVKTQPANLSLSGLALGHVHKAQEDAPTQEAARNFHRQLLSALAAQQVFHRRHVHPCWNHFTAPNIQTLQQRGVLLRIDTQMPPQSRFILHIALLPACHDFKLVVHKFNIAHRSDDYQAHGHIAQHFAGIGFARLQLLLQQTALSHIRQQDDMAPNCPATSIQQR